MIACVARWFIHPIFSDDLSSEKVPRTILRLAFPRKSRIQPENKLETQGANSESPLYVDNGRVIRVTAVDTLRLKELVS